MAHNHIALASFHGRAIHTGVAHGNIVAPQSHLLPKPDNSGSRPELRHALQPGRTPR
jgi:hypothetical protein